MQYQVGLTYPFCKKFCFGYLVVELKNRENEKNRAEDERCEEDGQPKSIENVEKISRG